jgi:hypothetical protein
MIYTSYDMIQDCRADKAEGWRYFVAHYVPVLRKMTDHYAPGDTAITGRVLAAARRESSLFRSLDPAPERWFVAQLRQVFLSELPAAAPEIELPLETVAEALDSLTLTQKLASWIETMRYDAGATAAMLRMSAPTVEKIRGQAADLIRGKVDSWRRTLLPENGLALSKAAAAISTTDCAGPKVFLDVLDGRATWLGREEMERHVAGCWHCIDHFARMAEVIELLRNIQPLTESEAQTYLDQMGIAPTKKSFWKR